MQKNGALELQSPLISSYSVRNIGDSTNYLGRMFSQPHTEYRVLTGRSTGHPEYGVLSSCDLHVRD
jgi:hypothetical protein